MDKYAIMGILYFIGVMVAYIFFLDFFKKDNLTDTQFKLCITFFSFIWPFMLVLAVGMLIIAPSIALIFAWLLFMIIEPKKTWADTKKGLKKLKFWEQL